MKKIFTIIIVFLSLFSYGQIAPTIVNERVIGGISPLTIVNYGGAIYNFNNITLGGTTKASDGDVLGNHNNSKDFWIVNLDSNLAIKWQKSLGGSNADYFKNFKPTPDSGYIVIGEINSSDGDVSNYYGGGDVFVVKLDKNGQIEWKKTFGGSGYDLSSEIICTSDNGYLIGAYTNSTNGIINNNHGSYDTWVIKLDSNGNLIWQKCFGGTNYDGLPKILEINNGYMIASTTYSLDGDIVGNHGGTDVLIIKTDLSGNIIWKKTFGGSYDETISTISLFSNTEVIISGNTKSNDGNMAGNIDTSGVWVSIIDINGNFKWTKFYPSKYETIMGIYKVNSNNYVIATTGTSLYNQNNYYGESDVVLTNIDTNGTMRWHKNYGGHKSDLLRSVKVLNDESLLISAATKSNDYDVSGQHDSTSDDVWLLKVDIYGTVIWQKCLGGSINDGWDGANATYMDGYFYVHCTTSSYDGDVHNPDFKNGYWIVKLKEGNEPNQITGRIYSDLNSNNKPDASDIFVDNIKIQATKSGNINTHISSDSGKYYFYNDTGNYIIQPISSFANFATIPISQTIVHANYGNKDTVNFKLAPTAFVNDASLVLINNAITRTNRASNYTLSYTNESGQYYNGTIKLKLDSRLSYQSAIPAPTTIVGDTMIWNIVNLPLFTTRKITVDFIASSSLVTNDSLKSFAKIYNAQADVTPLNNQYTLMDIVVASYDPNDKIVDKTILSPNEVGQSPYLLYTIRFQNVGNDTAFNISITDTLDANLDWITFQPITASHNYQLTQTNGKYIKFDFQNIKLPDSTRNKISSQGFIAYKIKTKNNLVTGNSILNRASIVFDVNAPVVTNTTKTVIMQTYAGRDTTICPAQSVTLTASGATTYVWNTGAITPSITVSPTTTTTYIVTGTTNGVSQKDTIVVNVKPLPIIDIGNNITLCTSSSIILTATGNATAWLWNTGETTKSISKNAVSATYSVVASLNGCTNKDSIVVTVVNSNIKINPILPSVCLNDSIQLNATGATNYAWSTGQTASSIIVKPVTDSMIKLEGWNSYNKLEGGYNLAVVGYVDNMQHLLESWGIDANTTVTPNINFNTLQELATYMNSVEPQGNWYVSGQNILAQNPNIKYRNGNGLQYFANNPTPATYTVRYNDRTLQNQKCASRDSVIVDVKPLPDVAFTKIVNNTQVQLNAPSGNSSYSWSFGDATPNSTAQNPLHNYTSNGKYYITLTSILNGCTAQKTDSVNIVATAINNNISFVNNINIYPNPTDNFITLQLNAKKSADFSVSLITIDGRILTTKKYASTSTINDIIDLKNYSIGIYFLQIKSEEQQVTYQIIKK